MRWEDEAYVRVYTRDTPDWVALSWDAQGLFMHLLRVVDRAGILELGRMGKRGVALAIHQSEIWDGRLAPALEELLADGCVTINGSTLLIPNFVDAQEAKTSDKERKRKSRATARDCAAAVTNGHKESQPVTKCHTQAELSLAEQSLAELKKHIAVPAEKPADPPPAKKKAIAPEEKALMDQVGIVFEELRGHPYAWNWFADLSALRKLRNLAMDSTVLLLWRNALASSDKWLRCNSLGQLQAKFNDHVDAEKMRRGAA